MDCPRRSEEPMPGGARLFEGALAELVRLFSQLPGEGAGGVGGGVGVVVEGEQATFFGVEEEHEAHEDRDGRLVHLGRLDPGGQKRRAGALLVRDVCTADGRDQHLNYRSGLLGQPLGDLLLALQAEAEQGGEGLAVGYPEEPQAPQ